MLTFGVRQDNQHLNTFKSFIPKIYQLNDNTFQDIALEVFQFQAEYNPVYRDFLRNLGVSAGRITQLNDIPFLPVSLFKSHTIQTGNWTPTEFFQSSGTTGMIPSRHAVADVNFYCEHADHCFRHFFGNPDQYHFLALLPSYLERSGSSLITMLRYFIEQSQSVHSGFYLYDQENLLRKISELQKENDRKIILWGVSFALLDLAEKHKTDLGDCYIFETGGMKGRRREITREELHAVLTDRLNASRIYSEYGMTELFSQAYTQGDHRFFTPPQMKIIGRDVSDPFSKGLVNENAGINVVDLGNLHSISFIETEDLGKVYEDGSFRVLGRLDNSEIRGCNWLL